MIDLENLFPGLRGTTYDPTSSFGERYNCIAHALGDAGSWWWPVEVEDVTWPASVPMEETIAAFELMLLGQGFVVCADDRLETGFTKVALFADDDSFPTHAARQLPSGKWTSKLGKDVDVEHNLRALEGDLYGRVIQIFRRPAPT